MNTIKWFKEFWFPPEVLSSNMDEHHEPMELPSLVRKKLFTYLDGKSMKTCRLVNRNWTETINEEGPLCLLLNMKNKDNVEFVSRVCNPYSLTFINDENTGKKYNVRQEYKGPDLHTLIIEVMGNFQFLKKELFPRTYLKVLKLCGECLWRSSFFPVADEWNERCVLPNLKVLVLSASEDENPIYHVEFHPMVHGNMSSILKLIETPSLQVFICCNDDYEDKDIGDSVGIIQVYINFIIQCSKSLRTLKLNLQRELVKNEIFGSNLVFPQLETFEFTTCCISGWYDLEPGSPKSYWELLLENLSQIKILNWAHDSMLISPNVLSCIIRGNENTLENLSFTCKESKGLPIRARDIIRTPFDCSVLSECLKLKELLIGTDWELFNLDKLPKTINNLEFDACIITTQNLRKLQLPILKSISVNRKIYTESNSGLVELDIDEEAVKFLTHIRSLNEMFVRKCRNKNPRTGNDDFGRFVQAFSSIALSTHFYCRYDLTDIRYQAEHYSWWTLKL